jgi:hypothetical protein
MEKLLLVLVMSLIFTQEVSSEEVADVDLSGLWKGSTICPLGAVSYAIEINKNTGVVRHAGYGPTKKHPLEVQVKIEFTKGWEGVWVRLLPLNPEYEGSFSYLSALVSADKRIFTVRPRHGIGDCRGFQLTKSAIPAMHTSPKSSEPPGKREPTADEMQAAFEAALHGGKGSLEVNNSIAGISVTVTGFEKLACTKANGKPGYICDFLFETDTLYRSNEGNEAGERHAAAVQQLTDWLGSMSNAPKHTSSSRRFLWVEGRGSWVMLKDE